MESPLRKKSTSTKVTPFYGYEDLFRRLSSAVGTPEADTQKVVHEDVPENQEKEEESEKDGNEGYYKNGDKLDKAVEILIELQYNG